MLNSLLHIGAAHETETWGQARKFLIMDVLNDLLALTVRCSFVHVFSPEIYVIGRDFVPNIIRFQT